MKTIKIMRQILLFSIILFTSIVGLSQDFSDIVENHWNPLDVDFLNSEQDEINPINDIYLLRANYGEEWDDLTNSWMPEDSVEYTYDNEGYVLERLVLKWDNISWTRIERNSYSYENDYRRTTITEEIWNGQNWVNINDNRRYIIEYNENGDLLLDWVQKWEDGIWTEESQRIRIYQTNNNYLIEWIRKVGNSLGILQNVSRSVVEEHNSFGYPLRTVNMIWEDNAWIEDTRFLYEYDEGGNQLVSLKQNLEEENWINYRKMISTYNSNNDVLTLLVQNWNIASQSWVNDFIGTREYNENFELILSYQKDWNSQMEDWEYNNQTKYYWENGQYILREFQLWDDFFNDWRNVQRFHYQFDENGNNIDFLFQIWLSDDEGWRNTSHTISYYDLFVVDAEELQSTNPSSLRIAPNPNKGNIQLNFNNSFFSKGKFQIRLLNMQGQVVQQFKKTSIGNSFHLNLNTLPNGSYILHLIQGEKIAAKKIIISK